MGKLAKEELKQGFVYMCEVSPNREEPLIWYCGAFNLDTDYDREYQYEELTTIEHVPNTQVDTLQEVVDWCKENGKEVCIGQHNFTYVSDCFDSDTSQDEFKPTDLLTHIRKPKHTPEELEVLELAKMYGIKIELK